MNAIRNLDLIGVGVFSLGFGLKLFHIHYHTIVMLVGLSVILFGLIATIRQQNWMNTSQKAAEFFILAFLLVIVKFLKADTLFFILSCLTVSLVVLSVILLRRLFNFRDGLIMAVFSLSIFFYGMEKDRLFYFMTLKNSQESSIDYRTWDKYSWMLYLNGKYELAAQTSDKALQIAKEQNADEWQDIIQTHQRSIVARSWDSYH